MEMSLASPMTPTSWRSDATPEGAGIEEFLQVEAEVKETLPRAPANRLKGVAAFWQFCLSVDTLPVRGIACAMVEKVLHHIFLKSPGSSKEQAVTARNAAAVHEAENIDDLIRILVAKLQGVLASLNKKAALIDDSGFQKYLSTVKGSSKGGDPAEGASKGKEYA